jgi:thermitase
MSFDYPSYSAELANAVKYANSKGVISVASAGNDGQQVAVYPGALPLVIDVASTSNSDIQSVFTNYGAPPVWMAAPGEGVMTTFPWGTYAAGWGTSFSGPSSVEPQPSCSAPTGTAQVLMSRRDWRMRHLFPIPN